MKTKISIWLTAVCIMIAMGIALMGPARSTLALNGAPAPIGGGQQGKGRHPEIVRAMAALRQARADLQRGAHDFGGHRVKAIQMTNQALAQCRAALAYDKH